MAAIEVRRAADRFRTEADGRSTAHSFAFGTHYDPANIGWGPLIAHNDELLAPEAGYADHAHADVEIVSWVVTGALRHGDDHGHEAVVPTGAVQVLSAGEGVVHRELAGGMRTRFIQSWLRPDVEGGDPTYASAEVAPVRGGWVTLAGDGGLPIRTAGARLLLGTPGNAPLVVPDAPRLHVFVLGGSIEVAGHVLGDGDALRATDAGELVVTGRTSGAQVLAWLLP